MGGIPHLRIALFPVEITLTKEPRKKKETTSFGVLRLKTIVNNSPITANITEVINWSLKNCDCFEVYF